MAEVVRFFEGVDQHQRGRSRLREDRVGAKIRSEGHLLGTREREREREKCSSKLRQGYKDQPSVRDSNDHFLVVDSAAKELKEAQKKLAEIETGWNRLDAERSSGHRDMLDAHLRQFLDVYSRWKRRVFIMLLKERDNEEDNGVGAEAARVAIV